MRYLTCKEVETIHDFVLKKQDKCITWYQYENWLEPTLIHIQNNKYYPNFIEKSTHLFFNLIKSHIFNDWNKRTAIFGLLLFWDINWFDFLQSFAKLEDITIWVAKWHLEKQDLRKIFLSIFDSFDFDYTKIK